MKILFACNDLEYFMAHRAFIADEMVRLGHEVHVCAGIYQNVDLTKALAGMRFHPLSIEKHRLAPFSDFSIVRKYRQLLVDEGFDVVHAITIKPNLFMSVAMTWVKYFNRAVDVPGFVMTYPGLGKVYEPTKGMWPAIRKRIVTGFLSWTQRLLKPFATFENRETRDQLVGLGLVLENRTRIMMGAGINQQLYYPGSRSGKIRVLYAGRLLRSKGIDTFLKSVLALNRDYPNVEFVIAGQLEEANPDRADPALIEKAAEEENIRYLRFVEPMDMPDLLRSSDVVCVPTRLREGFPRVILEAAACGCAVIASKQPVVELIIEHGKTGWLIDPPNCQNLTSQLHIALENFSKTRKIGENAAEKAVSMPIYESDILFHAKSAYHELLLERDVASID